MENQNLDNVVIAKFAITNDSSKYSQVVSILKDSKSKNQNEYFV